MVVDLGISDCNHTLFLQDGDRFWLTTEKAGRKAAIQVEVRDGKISLMGDSAIISHISGLGMAEKVIPAREAIARLQSGEENSKGEKP